MLLDLLMILLQITVSDDFNSVYVKNNRTNYSVSLDLSNITINSHLLSNLSELYIFQTSFVSCNYKYLNVLLTLLSLFNEFRLEFI